MKDMWLDALGCKGCCWFISIRGPSCSNIPSALVITNLFPWYGYCTAVRVIAVSVQIGGFLPGTINIVSNREILVKRDHIPHFELHVFQRSIFLQCYAQSNKTWVFYRGRIAVPSGSYRTEFMAFAIVAKFFQKCPCNRQGFRLLVWDGITWSLILVFFIVINGCGNMTVEKLSKNQKNSRKWGIGSLFANPVTRQF